MGEPFGNDSRRTFRSMGTPMANPYWNSPLVESSNPLRHPVNRHRSVGERFIHGPLCNLQGLSWPYQEKTFAIATEKGSYETRL